ncbi:tRNA pseudouridine synthase B [Marinithermofilum abyssi]|jgi:tRNA pseudouridine55 synthase|uniref:tRNA pseudouridine synthase B n=1 Tax=Marinithermofilum abyssi TaxID=1571185 RepID=A0A8J2YEK1_9BACL|nr:tRNA pseudouridine(55) synthase TruB [Marinithermofilum abyssi]GGE25130.1 tRNA pseudouridine synthase B [Marinithermofilum abyssi]
MLHGVIPIRKLPGMTSHDVVARVRRIAGQKKAGHTGTLDPDVEGVLPVCLGQATRIAEYIQDLPKRYHGTLTLGIATDTEDASGRVTAETAVDSLDPDEVNEVFRRFVGEMEQIPPMYSAVKIKGKRLYELAREGKEVERKSRTIRIYELIVTWLELDEPHPRIHFDVLCSKGTYVRTLCVDLGKALGYPAHMSRLIRVESGPFHLEDAVTLDALEERVKEEGWDQLLVCPGEALGHLPVLFVPESAFASVMNGMTLQLDAPVAFPAGSLCRVYTEEGRFCALYRLVEETTARPEKVFRVR